MRAASITLAAAAVCSLAAPAQAELRDALPRFEDPVCPGVIGLQVEPAELLVGRIRENAKALDRSLASPENCEPNLLVAFVDSGRDVLQQMARDESQGFGDMSPIERNRLLAQTGPVHVLSQVVTRTRDGMPLYGQEDLSSPPQSVTAAAHSKLYSASRRDIVHVLVLFDRGAISGLTVNQLADYATVAAFVHEQPGTRARPDASILDLFDARASGRPSGLTAFDQALLGSLYQGLPNINGTVRLAEIEHATGRALDVR